MKGAVGWSECQDKNEWDDFVTNNGGSAYHLWAWREVLEEDDHKPLYLVYRRPDGKITAACPFFRRAGRHLQYLESLPDSDAAGPVTSGSDHDLSEIVSTLPKSVEFTLSHPIVAMRIKAYQEPLVSRMKALGFQSIQTSEIFDLDLWNRSPEHIWNNGFDKHDRQAVKYYEQRASFSFTEDESDYLALERPDWSYYQGRLFRPGFIPKMKEKLGERLKVAMVVASGGATLAGFLMLIDPPNNAGSRVHLLAVRHSAPKNIHSAVTFLNWKAISWANANGIRYVDFGAYSRNSSSDPLHAFHRLKERFEITPVPRYEFTLPTSDVTYSIARRINRITKPQDLR